MDQSRYLRPMELSEILDASVRLYRKNFSALITVQLPLTVIFFFILVRGGTFTPLDILISASSLVEPDIGSQRVTSLVYLIQLCFVHPLILGALTKVASDSILKGSSSVREAYKFSLRNKGKLIVTFFIISIVVEFIVVLFYSIALMAIIDARMSGYTIYFVLALICALIFLAVGTVVASFLWVRWVGVFPIIVNEEFDKIGSLDAMKRSWNLLTGYTVKMFFVIFTVTLIPYIIQATPPSLGYLMEKSLFPLTIVFELIALGVIYPLVSCTRVVIYFELKVRKEGLDLEKRVEQLMGQS